LPRSFTPPAALSTQVSGFPSSCISGFAGDGASSRLDSRILRRCRLTAHQVALDPGPSVSPLIRLPGCPESRIFRLRLVVSQVALGVAPSGCARFEVLSHPKSSSPARPSADFRVTPNLHLWFRRRTNFQVALNLRSFGVADNWIRGSPRVSVLRRSVNASSGCPDSTSTVGSMMNPWLSSNFASSACAADESSCPTGPAFPA
jgi:hypothetical protein